MKSDPMEGILSRKNKAKLHKPFDDVGAVLDEIKSFNKKFLQSPRRLELQGLSYIQPSQKKGT